MTHTHVLCLELFAFLTLSPSGLNFLRLLASFLPLGKSALIYFLHGLRAIEVRRNVATALDNCRISALQATAASQKVIHPESL